MGCMHPQKLHLTSRKTLNYAIDDKFTMVVEYNELWMFGYVLANSKLQRVEDAKETVFTHADRDEIHVQ